MLLLLLVLSFPVLGLAQAAAVARGPIIDMHLHAADLDVLKAQVAHRIIKARPPASTEEHVSETLKMMERFNIVLGIVSGDLEGVDEFRRKAPGRVWAAPHFGKPGLDLADLRARYLRGELRAMGEITAQYEGLSPSDVALEAYFALAEELDIPVGIHTGVSSPGITTTDSRFRVSFGNPILVEDLLNRHPKLRVYLMHGGWPFLAETLGILHVYPQVYVDIAVINWVRPREDFYSYLRELLRAGFGNRIMFGTDQMEWPDAIEHAVRSIDEANFLSPEQKRDIFYNNAARFLKLTPEQIAVHNR